MSTTQAQPGFLKQSAAAAFLGVTVRTLHRWERMGLVSGRRVVKGGAKFYAVEGLRRVAAVEAQAK